MADISSKDFSQVYEMLGIDTGRLGCIMLDTAPLTVSDVIPQTDLYEQKGSKSWGKGYISEVEPHVTLLYGLMRSGQELKYHADIVLKDWSAEFVTIDEVSFFYGKEDDGTQFITIIALVKPDPNLVEGNARLRFLPHVDTFPEYHPHITLAYVKSSSPWEDYIKKLDERFAGGTVAVTGLNYGD